MFSLVSGISPVYGQENTPVPTNTQNWQPIYQTPTPFTVNTTCPGEQPGGFGQVTPNPIWMNYCSHCITPVNNWDGWGDFDWGDNPFVPTITPTPDLSGFTSNYYIKYVPTNYTLVDGVGYATGFNVEDLNTTNRLTPNVGTKDLAYTILTQLDMSMEGGGHWAGQEGYLQLYLTCGYGGTCRYNIIDGLGEGLDITLNENTSHTPINITYCSIASGCEWEGYSLIQVTKSNTHSGLNNGEIRFWKDGNYYSKKVIGTYGVVYKNGYHGIEDMITPAPTPIPNSDYCSVINGLPGSGPGDDENEDGQLPGITIGISSCLTVGGFEIPLDWINNFLPGDGITNWYVPGLSLCFTPVDFGQLRMFGISFDLDLWALMMAGLVLYKIIQS